jgi:hypothetical protein
MVDTKKVAVFLYGSFMSPRVLSDSGLTREIAPMEVAMLEGFDIAFSPNATIVPSTESAVYGVLAELTGEELKALYSPDWLKEYKATPVMVKKKDRKEVPATCYIAPLHPNRLPKTDYVARVIETAISHGFPSWYIERMRKAGLPESRT